jgi:hypothetical protein
MNNSVDFIQSSHEQAYPSDCSILQHSVEFYQPKNPGYFCFHIPHHLILPDFTELYVNTSNVSEVPNNVLPLTYVATDIRNRSIHYQT